MTVPGRRHAGFGPVATRGREALDDRPRYRPTMASAAPTRYDPATALIVVDVQNDFADPRGSLFVKGGMEVAERCSAEAWRASQAGALVAYTQDWHPPS